MRAFPEESSSVDAVDAAGLTQNMLLVHGLPCKAKKKPLNHILSKSNGILAVIFRISKASPKLLNLTFGRFVFYKAVYASVKEGQLNLFRYSFTIKLCVLLYVFSFFFSSRFLQQRCTTTAVLMELFQL